MRNRLTVSSAAHARWVTFPSGPHSICGFLARPTDVERAPVVVMAHENLGLTEHRRDVTRAIAEHGFACLTVDLYSRIGGEPPQDYSSQEERRAKAFLAARDEQAVPDLQAGLDYLATRPDMDTSRAGAIGFCLGGGPVLVWATQTNALRCVVSLYGIPILPPEYSPDGQERSRVEIASQVRCPVQAHFGGADPVIPLEQVEALREALRGSAQPADVYVYEGAGHAYHDDTHPNYHPDAARLTWERAMDFFREHL